MDKTEFFTVIENQMTSSGAKALLYNHYDGQNEALARYYTVCAAAAVSELPYHAAHLLSSKGYMVEQHIFDRRTPEAEVE